MRYRGFDGRVRPFTSALAEVGQSVPIIDSCQSNGRRVRARSWLAAWGELADGPVAQRCELVEAVQPRDQKPGVDGAGDRRRRVDLRNHRDLGDVGDVACGEAAPRFAHQHDPVRPSTVRRDERTQREVARSA